MKKIASYILTLLTLASFSACKEDFKDWANPQKNDQEEAKSIAFSIKAPASSFVDLNAYENQTVALAQKAALNNPPNSTESYDLVLTPIEGKAGAPIILSASFITPDLVISVDTLQQVVERAWGKRPVQRTFTVSSYAYVTDEKGQTLRAKSTVETSFVVIPKAPVIENNYYIIGDVNNWSQDDLLVFGHSEKDVYEDPVFTVVFKNGANSNFKIVPESAIGQANFWDLLIGSAIDQNESLEGTLVFEKANAMKIVSEGYTKITIDMMDQTYRIEPLGDIEDAYYIIGNMNNWDPSKLIKFNHSSRPVSEDPIFTMTVDVPADCFWKIIPQSNVDSGNVWDTGVLGTKVDGDPAPQGNLVVDNPQAGKIVAPGWTRITIDMRSRTYKVEPLGEMKEYLLVPGQHQGWAPDAAPKAYTRSFNFKYEAYLSLVAGEGFKLVTGPGWDGTNYGDGGDHSLSTDPGAGNLAAAETGFNLVTCDLMTMTWKTEKTDWGLIGSATPSGWDASTPMVLDPATGLWSVTVNFVDGAFKFRANDEWAINLGGGAEDLTYGGTDINITAGTYTITLDLTKGNYSYTLVKN